MKTAFAYHRYSYVDQKDGYTLEVQRKTTKRLAEKYGCQIIGIYEDEGISGATIEKRPQMLSMLSDLQKQKPDYIICVDQDRIARGNGFWYIKNLMSQNNVSFITEKEGIINFTEDITKDFLSDIIASAAKYERGMIRQRVKRAMAERADKGLFVGNLTRVLGYDWHEGNLKINEKEAEIVRLVFDMYIQGKGYYYIASYLNQNGYRTKFGGYFTPSIVMRILKKPLYCGYITHVGKLIRGVHEPIISEEIFEKARSRYEENKKRNPRMKVKHLLTGFLFCGSCGSRMQIGYHSGKNFYGCSAYYKNICSKPVYIRKEIIEEYVTDKITELLSKMDLNFENEIDVHKNGQTRTIFDSKKQEQKIMQKIDRLLEQYVEGNVSETQYRRLNERLKRELEAVKSIKTTTKPDISFLKNIKTEELFSRLDLEDKRKILEVLIDKIVIKRSNKKHKLSERAEIYWNKVQK